MSRIALPATFRFALLNATGISISTAPTGLPTITGERVRFDPVGALSYEATAFTFFSTGNVGSIGNNSYVTGSTWSNTLSAWLGGDFLVSAFASGGASGALSVFLELSPDNGTTWPTPASAAGTGGGIIVAVIDFGSSTTVSTASTTRRRVFEL